MSEHFFRGQCLVCGLTTLNVLVVLLLTEMVILDICYANRTYDYTVCYVICK